MCVHVSIRQLAIASPCIHEHCNGHLITPPFSSFSPEVTTHVDDEYAWAGVEDPKVVVTTSHSPSSRLKQFAKVSSTTGAQLCKWSCILGCDGVLIGDYSCPLH